MKGLEYDYHVYDREKEREKHANELQDNDTTSMLINTGRGAG